MSAADFANAKGERFAVALLGEDGAPTQNVVVQVREKPTARRERKSESRAETRETADIEMSGRKKKKKNS